MTSMLERPECLDGLEVVLRAAEQAAIAVSGGVDSLTLAHVAMRAMPRKPILVHALSPAVPVSATTRVRQLAQQAGWTVRMVNAGELRDARYVSNPVNRCYYCKSNLYRRIKQEWSGPLFSGANMDDLDDYRPGLIAADEHQVRHPFVEAGVDKSGVRAIAAYFGLDDIAELPAQPCLSSRVETGIVIDAEKLLLIDGVESQLRVMFGPVDVRCRLRVTGLHVELDRNVLADLNPEVMNSATNLVRSEALKAGLAFNGFTQYLRGSAFLDRQGNAD